MCCSRAKLDPSPHTSPCRQTRLPCDSLSASSLPRAWAACTRPREKRRPWRGELICPMGRRDRSDSEGRSCRPKVGWSGVPLPSGAGGEEGERLCLEAGCSRGDPAVSARFLCNVQAAFSLLDVGVLSGGKPRAWELSEGEVFS